MSSPDLPAPPPAPPTPGPPPAAEQPAGWFPDPNGRHEHRYFNGRTWTADVADGGERSVDPLGAAPTPARPGFPPAPPNAARNGMATAALVCGLIGVGLAWIPFVVVAGFVLSVLAIVFGVSGLRQANLNDRGRGKAIAGTVLGGVGVALSVLGVILSVVVFRELRAFVDPVAHAVDVVDCEVGDGVARVSGTVTNLGDERAEFSLFVTVRAGTEVSEPDTARTIAPLDPGATADLDITTLIDSPTGPCTASVDVYGPLPFGVDMERP